MHSASLRRSSQQASVAVPHNGAGPGAKGSPNGRATLDETIGRRWHRAVPGRGKGTKMNSIIYIIGLVVVVGAVLAQYLNFFVLIVQSFQKIPALKTLAPTQKEPPFAITQLVFLILFIVLGVVAVNKFHI